MIEYEIQPTDFALTFEGHCNIGWSGKQKENIDYLIENHYEKLIVNIDDANLGKIIAQVVSNAAEHTETGFVRARYDYVGDKLMIAVEDTGPGIPPHIMEHIYERFTTGNSRGTGLGLPICKELIEQMGGKIEISTMESRGTTVWITLPCEATTIDRKKRI
jgi:signal transduction histidine kinase